MIGRTISHYRIEEKLGEGGMGVVYRAQDLSLNRPVAIKFLSSKVADEERRRRFQQEAQTASALNHPHILTVFEAGTTEDNQQYLVTEFIDGWNLREWAKREQPTARQMVELMTSIADGLATAHQAGIVHRDVKPENILVAKAGYAKVVDFGLAKLLEPASGEQETRTLDAVATRAGAILGTVAYMSPEQASGRVVDARSDIFSFGVVLYELVAGARPFAGKSDIELLNAVITAPSPPLPGSAPAELRGIVEKALEKEPAERYQSMREVVVDLKRSRRTRAPEPAAAPAAPRRRSFVPALAGAAVLLAVLAAVWLLRRPAPSWENPLANARFTRLTDFEGSELDAAISPDGKSVVFVSDRDGPFDAWITQIGAGGFVNLTKGRIAGLAGEVRTVGLSADGTQVRVQNSPADPRGVVTKYNVSMVPAIGGQLRPFVDNGISPAPSPDGNRIVYHDGAAGDPIYVADRNGNNPKRIYAGKPGDHLHFPTWSPDGRFIYFARSLTWPIETDIWRIPAAAGNLERMTRQNTRVTYSTFLDGRTLLYVAEADDGSGRCLYALDVESGLTRRASFGLQQYLSVSASASNGGRARRLVVTEFNPSGSLWTIPISERVQAESAAQRLALPTARATTPRFGPGYVLYLSAQGGAPGLWKFEQGSARELWRGSEAGLVAAPGVSPDGRQICFAARSQGRTGLYLMGAEGTNVRRIAESLSVHGAPSWSPDGKWIAVGGDQGKGNGLFNVPLDGGAPVPLVDKVSWYPAWSGDGRLLLYSESLQGPMRALRGITPERQPVAVPDLQVRYELGDAWRFVPGRKAIVVLQGGLRRQNFWLLDLDSGRQRQLTNLASGVGIRSFDVSPDGKQILFDRVKENSDIVLIELPGS